MSGNRTINGSIRASSTRHLLGELRPVLKRVRRLLNSADLVAYLRLRRGLGNGSEKRKRRRFGLYRVMTTETVFLKNYDTQEAAVHAAACLQVCAPANVSYVIDPPGGTLGVRPRVRRSRPPKAPQAKVESLEERRQQGIRARTPR
jgi:hypothetical protein